jgi:putative membrane protein
MKTFYYLLILLLVAGATASLLNFNFSWSAKVNLLVNALLLLVLARQAKRNSGGLKTLAVFSIMLIIPTAIELIGISQTFLGTYDYSNQLGPKFFGYPYLVMTNWLLFFIASAQQIRHYCENVHWQNFGAAILMVFLDFQIEALAATRHYWTWRFGGDYYGAPWYNFLAWFLISFGCFELITLILKKRLNFGGWKVDYLYWIFLWFGVLTNLSMGNWVAALIGSIGGSILLLFFRKTRRAAVRDLPKKIKVAKKAQTS